mgnify:CR=1 FL=1
MRRLPLDSPNRHPREAVASSPARLSLLCLLLAVTLVAATSGVVVAHQFVGFDRAPLTATGGESAEVPINLHRTDRVTVAVDGPGGGFTAVVVDDGDGQATVVIDTAATDSQLRVESGTLRQVTGDASLVPGEYELSLSVQRGLGDTTTLTLTEPTDGRQVSLPAVVGGLLGPLVPVAVLAVVARATRG